MKPPLLPQDNVFWYMKPQEITPLQHSIETDVVIIGGGMAGLSAAQAFRAQGKEVVVLEKNFCGAGASGKSSGFITPNSEVSLADLIRLFGPQEAKRLWKLVVSGVHHIKQNIHDYSIDCDFQAYDTLVVAHNEKGFSSIINTEYHARNTLQLPSTLYTESELPHHLGTEAFYGGIAYQDSFCINAYKYCAGMQKVLKQQGVKIYEETPALFIEENRIKTPHGNVRAEHIVVCTDQFTPLLGKLTTEVYPMQTYLLLTAPLSTNEIQEIFPTKKYLVWDTNLIYSYFRMTADNRLLVGGSSFWYSYGPLKHDNKSVTNKLKKFITTTFPHVPFTFEYTWPGLIGVSKDFLPLAGHDATNPAIYYIAGTAGLPWAAALGVHSAQAIVKNDRSFETYFSPYRKFPIGGGLQKILGNKLSFALSHFMASSSF